MTGRQSAAFTRLELCSRARPAPQPMTPRSVQGATCRDHGSCRPLPPDSGHSWLVTRGEQLYLYRQHSGQWSRPLRIDVCSVFAPARMPRYGPTGRGTYVTSPRGVAVQLRMSWHSCDSSFQKSTPEQLTLNPAFVVSTSFEFAEDVGELSISVESPGTQGKRAHPFGKWQLLGSVEKIVDYIGSRPASRPGNQRLGRRPPFLSITNPIMRYPRLSSQASWRRVASRRVGPSRPHGLGGRRPKPGQPGAACRFCSSGLARSRADLSFWSPVRLPPSPMWACPTGLVTCPVICPAAIVRIAGARLPGRFGRRVVVTAGGYRCHRLFQLRIVSRRWGWPWLSAWRGPGRMPGIAAQAPAGTPGPGSRSSPVTASPRLARRRSDVNRGRLEIFTDAVLAVAITLLALNLTVPGPGHGPLTAQLTHQWQAFAAYLISFLTIGVVWVNHHSLLSSVEVVTRSLIFFNLVLLVFVVLIPVSTRMLADYLPTGGFDARLAAAVYVMVLEGMLAGFFLITEWTLREGRTQPSFPPDRRRAARLRYLPGVVAFLPVIGAAFINALLALGLTGVSVVFYSFEQTPLRTKRVARLDDARLRPGPSRSRLEVFSDAVLAVAVTLLALNLTVAGPGHGPLTGQLTHQWQAFAAYLISFFTIGSIWANHHSLLSSVEVVTRSLLFFNLVLLVFVVLVPVSTRLLADYLAAGGSGGHLAAAVYGMVLEGMAVGFTLIFEWTLREGRTVPPGRRWAARLRYLPGPVAYLAVIGTAFIYPLLALGLSAVVDVYYAFEHAPLRARGWLSAQPDDDG
jgi:uncharacterized membrane protein